MILEYKDLIGGSVKDIDSKGRRVSGYLSTWDVKDSYGDIVVKGAFSKTLKERGDDIFFLNQHNWKQPFGKFDTLMEDDKGLYFVSQKMPDTSYANDVLKLYEAGILKEHSIGYVTMKDDLDKEDGTRYLKELKLYEGSVVTIGANRDTPFTGFKASMQEVNEQTKKILKALRNGDFTDDTFSLLEIALKQLQMEAYELGKKTLQEPSGDTPKAEPFNPAEAIYEYLKSKKSE